MEQGKILNLEGTVSNNIHEGNNGEGLSITPKLSETLLPLLSPEAVDSPIGRQGR